MAKHVPVRAEDDVAALYWQGRRFLEAGDWRNAVSTFRRAVRTKPSDPELHRLLGLSLARLDRFDFAISSFRNAVALAPDHAPIYARAHADLGVTLLKAGRVAEAIPPLETALARDAHLQQARLCLGMALSRNGAPDRALAILEPAVKHNSDPEVHAARAWAMLSQGRVEAAIEALHLTLRLNPGHEVAQTNLLFSLQHLPGITPAALLAAHRTHFRPAGGVPANTSPPTRFAAASARPVIGLVSGDLRRHAVGVLTLRAFEALSSRGCKIVCFASQPEDDDFTARYRAASAAFHRVDEMSDDALHALIQSERIEILFDLSGMTARQRLAVFTRRAAPIQVTWAGYPGTTGIDAMDALIADEREVPPGEEDAYTENILRLPDCYVCFEPPSCAPEVNGLPMLTAKNIRFGCFQRAPKLNRDVFALWARIAQAVPQALFVLRYGCYVEGETRKVVSDMAAEAGLKPSLLVFEEGGPQANLLAGYANIDVALDSFPYSGGVTTLEALWMGIPVVTKLGGTFAGRHSASHLHAAGLPELIATTDDAYVATAVALVQNVQHLVALRAGLRARLLACPLMDADRFAAHLESALLGLRAGRR
jgi:predicted O-linked N-acetylglucosamine transferase (SPINDLY family)